jgi:hypothetical protein
MRSQWNQQGDSMVLTNEEAALRHVLLNVFQEHIDGPLVKSFREHQIEGIFDMMYLPMDLDISISDDNFNRGFAYPYCSECWGKRS